MGRFNGFRTKNLRGVYVLVLAVSLGWGIPAAVLASDEVAKESAIRLTFEDAAQRALSHSYDLKLAEYNVEQGEVSREDAALEVNFEPTSGGSGEAAQKFINLVQKDISLSMSKKSLDVAEDSLTLDVYSKYCDVLAAQEKVIAAETALESAKYKLLAAQTGHSAGTISRRSLESSKVSCSNQELSLAQSRADLDQCYVRLNDLIGLSGQERPILAEDLEYSPLEITDLEVEITRRLDSSPTLWEADQEVYLAELSLDLYTYGTVETATYDSKKIDVRKAEISASQTKQQARENMRAMYQNICDFQDQYTQQQQALRLAESELESLELKYEMGLISRGDVLAAKADLASKKQALQSLVYEHQLLCLNFEKPWA